MKFSLPQKKVFLHSSNIPVNWGDMDALGHVNNTMYFRYMEIARVNWLNSLGIKLGENDQSFIIVNAFCEFLTPLTYPQTLEIKTFVSKIGNTSIDISHDLEIKDKHQKPNLIANGFVTCVWFNFKENKSATLPKVFTELLLNLK